MLTLGKGILSHIHTIFVEEYGFNRENIFINELDFHCNMQSQDVSKLYLLSHLTEHSQVTVLAGFIVRQTLLHLMS
jgi:hypothetical protein